MFSLMSYQPIVHVQPWGYLGVICRKVWNEACKCVSALFSEKEEAEAEEFINGKITKQKADTCKGVVSKKEEEILVVLVVLAVCHVSNWAATTS